MMMQFDAWEEALKAICGNYDAVPVAAPQRFKGSFTGDLLCGLDVADLSCNTARIERTPKGIRTDGREHLFLLVQIAGTMAVAQADERVILRPGSLYLLDSTLPARLLFEAGPSHSLSVHLPRAAMLADAAGPMLTGQALTVSTRTTQRLQRCILDAKDRPGAATTARPEHVMTLAREVFIPQTGDAIPDRMSWSQRSRFDFAVREMEMTITRPELSLGWLADRVGISTRQLERDFTAQGTSFVRLMRQMRLKLACDMIDLATRSGRRPQVTEIAFGSGFRDLSNFNRTFRAHVGLTPSAYIGECAIRTTGAGTRTH